MKPARNCLNLYYTFIPPSDIKMGRHNGGHTFMSNPTKQYGPKLFSLYRFAVE